MADRRRLSLVVPALAPPQGVDLSSGPLPALPALERLLARASSRTSALHLALELHVARRAGLRPEAVPVAAIAWRGEGQAPDACLRVRADPVFLRADRDQALMFDGSLLGIGAIEAAELVAAFNQHFSSDGWQLVAVAPARWYLTCPAGQVPPSGPGPRELTGEDINPRLPAGTAGRVWRQLLNDTQMLFHNHAVNAAREESGRALINSVWVWGHGPELDAVDLPWTHMAAGDIFCRGLAMLGNIPATDCPDSFAAWLHDQPADSHGLVVIERLADALRNDDYADWLQALEWLEQTWIQPALDALQNGSLSAIELDCLDGTIRELTPQHRWRFWRRAKPFFARGGRPLLTDDAY